MRKKFPNLMGYNCTYREIRRLKNASAEEPMSLGEETAFEDGYVVPLHIEAMKVICRNELSEDLQMDTFAFVQPRRSIPLQKSWHRRPSIIMLGMDNLSRMTLRNNMPSLFENIKKQGWFEMQGYTRIGQNSLPNLMALLTGYSPDTWSNLQCKSNKHGCIDSLPLIWKRFQRKGYITAYGEGSSDISMFRMDKSGFVQGFLDFFARPFEKIPKTTDCVDRRMHIQFIHDYSEQFLKRHLNTKRSQFGFFWTNKVKQSNHEADNIAEPIWLDHFVRRKKQNLFSQSIVIFFSDKGPSGNAKGPDVLAETQPMLLIWLPPWFRVRHPEIVQALRINGKRLTSAYDLHLTLHHILELGERWPRAVRKLLDCPTCQTLLAPVPENRTCADAGISEKLCPCDRYQLLKPKDYKSVPLGKLLVKSINEYLYHQNLHEICSKLKMKSMESVHLRVDGNGTSGSTFRVVFTASPNNPQFSATTRFSHKHKNLEYINITAPLTTTLKTTTPTTTTPTPTTANSTTPTTTTDNTKTENTTTPTATSPSTSISTSTSSSYLNIMEDTNRDNIVSYTYDIERLANVMHLSRFAANQSFYRLTNHSLDENFNCGYKTISKTSQGRYQEDSINKVKEIHITNGDVLPANTEAIITSCKTTKGKVLQINPQTFVNLKNQTKSQISQKQRPNILLIGFNGMTQKMISSALKDINMERWFKLQKFRRIGENYTYNLMALASGYSPSSIANLESTGSVPFIWKQFKSEGYVTALGEDIAFIRDLTLDFEEQPVDYYLRPFLQGIAESVELRNNTPNIENLLTSNYVLDYCEELLTMYAKSTNPFFGLFWTKISTGEAKESNLVDYFKRFKQLGLFDNTIVIFFSDHVCRPFLNIWLPDWFREKYPRMIRNLAVNKNRLSSPHDIYLTLRHILELSKDSPQNLIVPSQIFGCPTCQSLFEEIPNNRNCQSASNSENYCECANYVKISTKDAHKLPLGKLLVESLNQYLHKNKLQNISTDVLQPSVDV
ncbi:uncharacterized protein Dana_GF28191 [Drosophila ananassae]|uniref:Uncharacterized protein n=1 Tax=Drosophila ananassae TaxID=7217 RepID=A0A0P8XXQ1_DROAN|nr:uncharacterized protein Dana_GF28191 [Drosophila ananassae]